MKVKDADLKTIAAEIIKTTKTEVPIEVRGEHPALFVFDLKDATVGRILASVAQLNGSQLYLVEDRIIIAPEEKLSQTERSHNTVWNGNERPIVVSETKRLAYQMLPRRFSAWMDQKLAAAPEGTDTEKLQAGNLRLGDLSADMQQLIQAALGIDNPLEKLIFPPDEVTFPPNAVVGYEFTAPNNLHLTVTLVADSKPTRHVVGSNFQFTK